MSSSTSQFVVPMSVHREGRLRGRRERALQNLKITDPDFCSHTYRLVQTFGLMSVIASSHEQTTARLIELSTVYSVSQLTFASGKLRFHILYRYFATVNDF